MKRSISSTSQVSKAQVKSTKGWSKTKWQEAYHVFGFQKGYSLLLFIIFAGAMLGFTLARLPYLNIAGSSSSSFANSAAPGEWFWYRTGHYRVGITLHLGAILPAGFLMIFQFIPIIRHKLLLFHRINGYMIILLVLIANIGALMICRRAFGGSLETQAGVGVLAIISTTSLALAWYNIKRLQVDQHRKWMLRAMFSLGTIITLRLIMIISALIISRIDTFDTVKSCNELAFVYSNDSQNFSNLYPQCGNSIANQLVVVHASFKDGQSEQIGASLDMSFGMAMWLAIFLHLAGVEIYLALTPRESERLRQVSYERQLERGLKNPGSAGLTADRIGDAEQWKPTDTVVVGEAGR